MRNHRKCKLKISQLLIWLISSCSEHTHILISQFATNKFCIIIFIKLGFYTNISSLSLQPYNSLCRAQSVAKNTLRVNYNISYINVISALYPT